MKNNPVTSPLSRFIRIWSDNLCRTITVTVLSAVCGTGMYAGTPLGFDEVVSTIMENDIRIKATILSSQSELETSRAENVLADPEIDFEYQWGKPDVGNKWSAGISQSFDWPGVYAARGKANRLTEESLANLKKSLYAERRAELEASLVTLIGIKKKLDILEALKENVHSVVEYTEEGFRKGETTRLDINKLRIEEVGVNRQISDLNAEREQIMAEIRSFTSGKDNDDYVQAIDTYPSRSLLSIDYYLASFTGSARAEYLAQTEKVSDMKIKAARRSALPGFSLGYSYENEMGDGFHGVTAGISIPVYGARSRVKAAMAERLATQTAAEDELRKENSSIEADYHSARRLEEDIRLYGPLLINTDYLRLIRKAFEGGEMSVIEYLQEVNYFTDAQISYADMELRYHMLLTSLSKYSH